MNDTYDIFMKAKDRERKGLSKYGKFDPATDNRDMYEEMEEELLDVINYAIFQIKKLRYQRGENEKINK